MNYKEVSSSHPGEAIRELCLEPLELSITDAAKDLAVSRKTLSAILHARAGVSPEMAVEAIHLDANNELVVAAAEGAIMLAVLQLPFTPFITHQGGWPATIEGVRVDRRFRDSGVGRELFAWAICRAQERDCHLIQLTTDKQRPAALRF
jgi:addiction module HigA family antidote